MEEDYSNKRVYTYLVLVCREASRLSLVQLFAWDAPALHVSCYAAWKHMIMHAQYKKFNKFAVNVLN